MPVVLLKVAVHKLEDAARAAAKSRFASCHLSALVQPGSATGPEGLHLTQEQSPPVCRPSVKAAPLTGYANHDEAGPDAHPVSPSPLKQCMRLPMILTAVVRIPVKCPL